MTGAWWVYMIACRGGTIYTGIAKDPDRRFLLHALGKGAAYTRMNPPVALLARKAFPTRRDALAAEAALKKTPRAAKEAWAREHAVEVRAVPLRGRNLPPDNPDNDRDPARPPGHGLDQDL